MSEQTDRVRIALALGLTPVTYDDRGLWRWPGNKLVMGKLPNYFENYNHGADAICDWMRGKGYVTRMDNGLDGTWECTFTQPIGKFEQVLQFYQPGDTLPAAICAAFLAFLDSEKGDGR